MLDGLSSIIKGQLLLFTTAKTWKQPEWPLTKEEVKKMMQHYSALKRAK